MLVVYSHLPISVDVVEDLGSMEREDLDGTECNPIGV